jgi:hypothetical protein
VVVVVLRICDIALLFLCLLLLVAAATPD